MNRRAAAGLLLTGCLVLPASFASMNGAASAKEAASAKALAACPAGFQNVAHRGPHPIRDENTLSSFVLAGENGIDLEVDVRQDAQGVEWMHHDATLDRTTNGTGLFINKSTAHIESLRTEPRGQEIPTLIEALTTIAAYPSIEAIYLDLWSKNPTDAFINDVVDAVEAAGLEDRTYVVKFHPRMNRLAPDIKLQWKPPAGTTVAQMLAKNVESIAGPHGMLTYSVIQELRAGGQEELIMMSVNSLNSLNLSLSKGVNGVMGDSPFLIRDSCAAG